MTPSLLSDPDTNNWFKQIIFLKSLKKINLSGLDTSTNLSNEFNSRIQEKNDFKLLELYQIHYLIYPNILDNLSYRNFRNWVFTFNDRNFIWSCMGK